MSYRLIFSGDFCITNKYLNNNLFDKNIIEIFKQSDLNIINLECPVVKENVEKILKTGPHLKTNEKIKDCLELLNIDIVTLANNHILDYGEKGLINTLEFCENNKVKYVGAGIDFEEASRPLFVSKKELTIGILNYCKNEWSIARTNKVGANPINTIWNARQIKKAKERSDFVIVIVHGGHEYYSLPSPKMVDQYRFYVENGADAVIGHHTHCYSGYEIYQNAPIVYSLGNMIFTKENKNPNGTRDYWPDLK
ncbi:MAG: CapA family protein [bacterium]